MAWIFASPQIALTASIAAMTPFVAIVVERDVAHLRAGIAPGDREHRVALTDQLADQRILRRQVQDVVFHDPGRHDQHRLAADLGRRRRILDQFDQFVAEDDLAGRRGEILADRGTESAPEGAPLDRLLQVGEQILEPRREVRRPVQPWPG